MSTVKQSGTQTRTARPGSKDLRDQLDRTLRNGRDQVIENPVAAVIGAAAVSAGLALLLPASRRETELMGDVADRIGDAARGAADSAVVAGKAQVETLAQTALAGLGGAMIDQVVSNSNGQASPSDTSPGKASPTETSSSSQDRA